MTGVQLCPVDTWFFRGGTPFTAGSAPQENVGSLFPPHPPTLVGALRAALARANGWNGRDGWRPEIREVLGDGPNDLGKLSFGGPFLLLDGQPLFRAPRHLLGRSESGRWEPAGFLRPGDPVACDLGDGVRLPEFPDSSGEDGRLKATDDVWLTSAGMNAVLSGQQPGAGEFMPSSRLWSEEPRIGLERDPGTRSAKEGMLYSTRHVRPATTRTRRGEVQAGMSGGVSIGARIGGLPPEWAQPDGQLVPLGGESRLAEWRRWDHDLAFDVALGQIAKVRKVVLVALSPLDIDMASFLGETPVDGLGGTRVVCACAGRPQRIGGWDSRERRSLPLRSVLPAGSALFCEVSDPGSFEAVIAGGRGLAQIGVRREQGFGLVALGVWPDGG